MIFGLPFDGGVDVVCMTIPVESLDSSGVCLEWVTQLNMPDSIGDLNFVFL